MKKFHGVIIGISMFILFMFFSSCSFHVCKYIDIEVKPTCTEKGYVGQKCECGNETINYYVDPLGHNYTWSITKEPSLDVEGIAIGVCSNDVTHTTTETIPVLSEETVWTVNEYVESSCEENGYVIYTSIYGEVEITLDKTGHNFINNKCENCEYHYFTEGLEFTLLDDNTYSVNVGSTTSSSIIVPAIYNGKEVTRLDNYAFANCVRLKSIVIPDTVTFIGEYAFQNCNSLESIEIPFVGSNANGSGVRNFGYLFGSASYDTHSTFVPKSLKEVKITLETEILDNAFRNCNSIQKIVINEGVTNISDNAFYDCNSLINIEIPNSLIKTGIDSFKNCGKLTYNQYNTGMYLGNSNNPHVIFMKLVNDITTSCIISENTKCVYYGALKGYSNLKTITIPFVGQTRSENGATHFGYLYGAPSSDVQKTHIEKSLKEVIIKECENINFASFKGVQLEKITIPFVGKNNEEVTTSYLGYIFGASSSDENNSFVPSTLKEVKITNEKYVLDYAFRYCSSLEKIVLNDGIEYIGYAAFSDCSALENISLPDSVTSIGNYAFYECVNLKSISIPKNVSEIWSSSFASCYGLENIVVDSNNKTFDSRNNTNAIIETASNKLILGCMNTKIPNSIEIIGTIAFANCSSLISIEIPNSVTEIESSAFANCSSLANIKFSNNLIKIGSSAFSYCHSLKNIEIPNSVTSIGESAFFGCSSLESIVISNSVTSIGYRAFSSCSSLTSIEIPFVGNTLNGTSNTHFGFIFGADSYSNQAIYIPSSLKKVTIKNVSTLGYYSFAYCRNIETIIIEGDLTEITYGTFYECNNLVDLIIPDTVSVIDTDALYNCTNLKLNQYDNALYYGSESRPYLALIKAINTSIDECNIHKDTIFIGDNAFAGCTNLTNLVIPNNVKIIDSSILKDCDNIQTLIIPFIGVNERESDFNHLSYLFRSSYGYYVPSTLKEVIITGNEKILTGFESCSYIESIQILGNSTSIGGSAFDGCTSLKNITLPDSIESIGERAFWKCESLISVKLPSNLTTIEEWVFYNCNSLESLVIPDKVTSLNLWLAYECPSLKELVIGKSVSYINHQAIEECYSIESIVVDSENTVFDSRNNCNAIVETSTGNLIFGCNNTVIPEGIVSIGHNAFNGMSNFNGFALYEGLTSIGSYAFSGCVNIKNVVIPSSVVSIGCGVFEGCYNIESIVVDSENTVYDSRNNCNAIIETSTRKLIQGCMNSTIPEGILEIQSWAFCGMSGLEKIEIPEGVVNIGEAVFTGCNIESIVFPSTLERIGAYSLSNCNNLKSITLPIINVYYNGMPVNELSYLGVSSIIDEVIFVGGTTLAKDTLEGFGHIKSISLPSSLEVIEEGALDNLGNLEKIIVDKNNKYFDTRDNCNALIEISSNKLLRGCSDTIIPSGVVEIAEYAFSGCEMETIVIPNTVEVISRYAFSYCYSLKELIFETDSNLKEIGYRAFLYCTGLTSIEIPDSVQTIGEYTFAQCKNLKTLKIPFIGKYADGSGNLKLSHLFEHPNGNGYGEYVPSSLKELIVTGGSVIGYGALKGTYLTKLTLPFIGEYVDGSGRNDIAHVYGYSSIVNTSIKELVVLGGKTLGQNSLKGLNKLQKLTIPFVGEYENGSNNTYLGYLFGATSYYSNNDYVPSSLKEVVVLGGTSIPSYAFYGCQYLEKVTFGKNIKTIYHYAFRDCASLKEIVMHRKLTHVYYYAFENCKSLETLVFKGTEEQFEYVYIDSSGNSYLLNANVLFEPVEEEIYTINYYNSEGWNKIYIYIWNSDGFLNVWPGTTMKDNGNDWYKYELDVEDISGYNIIFSNGDGIQSADISLNEENVYFYGTSSVGYKTSIEAEEHAKINLPKYSVIGEGFEGSGSWDTDLYMEMTGNGIYETTIVVTSSCEFKIRKDGSWAINYGGLEYSGKVEGTQDGPNISISSAGTYKITFNSTTKEIIIYTVV